MIISYFYILINNEHPFFSAYVFLLAEKLVILIKHL